MSEHFKICKDCKESLSLEDFVKKQKNRDGRTNVCKKCQQVRHKTWLQEYMKNPDVAQRVKSSIRENQKNFKKKFSVEEKREWGRNAHQKLRQQLFDAYGRECACCGEKEEAFLTLEHSNHDGAQHRKLVGGGANTYRDLRRRGFPQEGYKILCMNCNWATRHREPCPHQIK